MSLRMSLLLMLAFAAQSARADCSRDADCKGGRICVANSCTERKACALDRDCPGEQVCDRNSCVAPARPSPSSGGAFGGSSREQSAAKDAGMALLYTRNTWPENIVDRPLMVAPGMTEVELNVDKDFSDVPGLPQHPLTSQLFARFGVSDRIHAVLDSVGVCFTDCDPTGIFSFISAYLGYAAVATHDVNVVTQFGFGVYNVIDAQSQGGTGSALLATAIPSVLFGWRLNPALQIFSFVAMNLGFLGRDHAFVPDNIFLKVEPRIQLAPRFALAPFIGYSLPLAHPEFYQLPVGVSLLFVPDRAVDIGLSFRFLDLLSHNVAPATSATQFNIGGTGARAASASVTFRL